MRRAIFAALLGVLALVVPTAIAQTGSTPTPPPPPAVAPGVSTATHPFARGMVLNNAGVPLSVLSLDIPRLALDGINTLTIYVYTYVESPTSSTVARTIKTPSDTELKTAIALAHANGMDVILMPLPYTDGTYAWRGTFHPTDVNAFFDSWRLIINHYAELAQSTGVSMLAIGSEQETLQGYTAQWAETAAQARERYSGLLTYLTNITNQAMKLGLWHYVDIVSISPYFTVSDAAVPTYDEMKASWNRVIIPYLTQLHEATNKPVFISEIGYTSSQYLGRHPYDPHPSQVPEPQAQADAYRAALDALASPPSWLYGLEWFSWDIPRGSILDAGYTPREKPAECVIAQYWGTGVVRTVANLLPCGSANTSRGSGS